MAEILAAHGLVVCDVEELPTHGGSLRVFAGHAAEAPPASEAVTALVAEERAAGLRTREGYTAFAARVEASGRGLRDLLVGLRRDGKRVAGYGAPGKGNTLLNYCRVGPDLVEFTVDRNPYKQGKLLPGTHIPIHHPDRIAAARPDCVLVLPWNLLEEIAEQLRPIRDWGGRLIVPIPEARLLE
jgi:hypothetical protein